MNNAMTFLLLIMPFLLVNATRALGASRDEVVARHTTSIDSLQSLTCKVQDLDVYHDVKRKDVFYGEYWRFGDRLKCTTKTADSSSVYVAQGGTARHFLTQTQKRGGNAYAGVIDTVNRMQFSPCDPWCAGMLHLSLPNTLEYLPLAELIVKAKPAKLESDETVGGSPCAKIAMTFECDPTVCKGHWQVTVWLSENHGMLVKKCRYEMVLPLGKRLIREDEVTDFVQTSTGGWFPKSVRYVTTIDGILNMTKDVTFSDVKTPQSLPDQTFDIKFRNPTSMTDHIKRTIYNVDESGARISPEKSYGVAESGSATTAQPPQRFDTEDEPRRYTPWILVGTSLTILAGVFLYIRRQRRRNDDTQ